MGRHSAREGQEMHEVIRRLVPSCRPSPRI